MAAYKEYSGLPDISPYVERYLDDKGSMLNYFARCMDHLRKGWQQRAFNTIVWHYIESISSFDYWNYHWAYLRVKEHQKAGTPPVPADEALVRKFHAALEESIEPLVFVLEQVTAAAKAGGNIPLTASAQGRLASVINKVIPIRGVTIR